MSVARGFLRLARKYEIRMKYSRDAIVNNHEVHITQLREAIGCAKQFLDISYEELENWSDSIQAVYEVDEFDNIFQRVELVFLKKYVNWMYSRTLKEIYIVEEAKKRLEKVLNTLEVLNAFRRM